MRVMQPSPSSFYSSKIDATRNDLAHYNRELLKIEEIIHGKAEIDRQQNIEINNKSVATLLEIEKKCKEFAPNFNDKHTKEFQTLMVKFAITAIKSGDSDWESFELSREIFENTENFFNSGECKLSVKFQIEQGITREERRHAWDCCLYNFAYQIAYHGAEAPGDENNIKFYSISEELMKQGVPVDVAFSIANVRNGLAFCKESLGVSDQTADPLCAALEKLNEFYEHYLTARKTNGVDGLILECHGLHEEMSLFIPPSLINRW